VTRRVICLVKSTKISVPKKIFIQALNDSTKGNRTALILKESNLADISLEVRKRDAEKPLFLTRYE